MADKPTSKRDQTRKGIRQAMLRIKKGRTKVVISTRKMSIAAVAEEAGVSRGTIHNVYPDLADEIREHTNKAVRSQRDEKHEALKKQKLINRDLRQEIARIRTLMTDITSENATLLSRNNELEAILNSKNVSIFRKK